MVHDIRTTTNEDHWSEFETAWTALMTYRYLGKFSPELDTGVERETMPLRRHDMRNATGGNSPRRLHRVPRTSLARLPTRTGTRGHVVRSAGSRV